MTGTSALLATVSRVVLRGRGVSRAAERVSRGLDGSLPTRRDQLVGSKVSWGAKGFDRARARPVSLSLSLDAERIDTGRPRGRACALAFGVESRVSRLGVVALRSSLFAPQRLLSALGRDKGQCVPIPRRSRHFLLVPSVKPKPLENERARPIVESRE